MIFGLDLGTTRIKAARLDADGELQDEQVVPAPDLGGRGEIRESDADAYAQAARTALDGLSKNGGQPVLGMASQRSSFLLWERDGGAPVTPLISWQDRRAATWCEAHSGRAAEIRNLTGLLLSPHYAGPKLAALLSVDRVLADRVRSGDLLFGNLDAFLVWKWTGGAVHATDGTMAARTLLADPVHGEWHEELLDLFGLPRSILPSIRPTTEWKTPLESGHLLQASIADQAAAVCAVLGDERNALVNLGTGGFVLFPTGGEFRPHPGFLVGPVLAGGPGGCRFALEGTINGVGPGVDRHGAGPSLLAVVDPEPDAFCLPDSSGLGSPHWKPQVPQTFSAEADRLPSSGKRRLVLEGLVFRVREILEGMQSKPPARILLSGGLSQDAFVAPALAACLDRGVEILEEAESTLLGAAQLAGGEPTKPPQTKRVEPGQEGSYLRMKYDAWKEWVEASLAGQA